MTINLNVANNAQTTLSQTISASDTSFDVQDATLFPSPPFRITIDAEIMEVGAVNTVTNTFSNVTRGMEGTTPAIHSSGAYVENRWTAGQYDVLKNAINQYTPADVLTKLLTVDGTGSGLDADMVDGKHAGDLVNSVSLTNNEDPDTTQDSYILTNHANAPGSGIFWHIFTFFHLNKTGDRSQLAISHSGAKPRLLIRHRQGVTWSSWTELLPLSGGTMTGILTAQNNTSYTTKQVRNITLSTGDPSGGGNGDIWIKYKP